MLSQIIHGQDQKSNNITNKQSKFCTVYLNCYQVMRKLRVPNTGDMASNNLTVLKSWREQNVVRFHLETWTSVQTPRCGLTSRPNWKQWCPLLLKTLLPPSVNPISLLIHSQIVLKLLGKHSSSFNRSTCVHLALMVSMFLAIMKCTYNYSIHF